MGLPSIPQDAAPAYDDVFHDHPVNSHSPSGSARAYATVPQDDIELQAEAHNHEHRDADGPAQSSETLAQTIAGVFRPKPHVHCEQCDVQLEARERRKNEKHCCTMVAVTFMVAFVCTMLLVLGVVGAAKAKKNAHG